MFCGNFVELAARWVAGLAALNGMLPVTDVTILPVDGRITLTEQADVDMIEALRIMSMAAWPCYMTTKETEQ